jgi:multiple antibiotic resistance protein
MGIEQVSARPRAHDGTVRVKGGLCGSGRTRRGHHRFGIATAGGGHRQSRPVAEPAFDFFRIVLLAAAALLPLLNPPGIAPIFLSMTPRTSDQVRATLALRIARNSFVLLVTAMLVGSYVLALFGLSLPIVKIAGGLLVTATAWQLVHADHHPDSDLVTPAPAMSAEQVTSLAFFPLTFPLTTGPGSLSVALTLGAGLRRGDALDLEAVFAAIAGIALVAVAVYFSYRYASRLIRALGPTGTLVLLRLSAFALLAIGVQILCDGLGERFAAGST